MKKNEKGFGYLPILLIIMALLLLAGSGYLVWNKNKTSKQESTTVSPNSSNIKPTYAGTDFKVLLFSLDSLDSKVTFSVPDGWVADKGSSQMYGFFADSLTYSPGTKFSISDSASMKDIQRFMLSTTDADDVPKEYATYKKQDYGKVNGNKTTLYYYEFSKGEHIGNVQMQGGEIERMYFITKGNDAVMVSYYVFAGDKDQEQLINQVIQTIKF